MCSEENTVNTVGTVLFTPLILPFYCPSLFYLYHNLFATHMVFLVKEYHLSLQNFSTTESLFVLTSNSFWQISFYSLCYLKMNLILHQIQLNYIFLA